MDCPRGSKSCRQWSRRFKQLDVSVRASLTPHNNTTCHVYNKLHIPNIIEQEQACWLENVLCDTAQSSLQLYWNVDQATLQTIYILT